MLYYEVRKTICIQGREKKMKQEKGGKHFWFEFEDRASGEGWKELDEKFNYVDRS